MATRLRRPRPASPTDPIWRGVRLRRLRIGADPDAPRRDVQIPALWDDDAAAALAALAPGDGPVSLPEAVDRWALPLADAVAPEDAAPDTALLARALADAVLCRRFAPDASAWSGKIPPNGITLRLSSFCGGESGEGGGFDLERYLDALTLIARLLPEGGQLRLTDLDAALAGIGLAYDSAAGRAAAACLAAIATARLSDDGTSKGPAPRDASPFAEAFHDAPPALAAAAAASWRDAAQGASRPAGRVVLRTTAARTDASDTGSAAVESLLGVEARGIAPVFAPVAADGTLRRSTLARLAAARLTPEQALARMLSGDPAPLVGEPGSKTRAHLAMHAAVVPFLDLPPPRPAQQFELDLPAGTGLAPENLHARPRRRDLPARHKGFTQKVTIGGHRLFLRTGEYDDGSLGEIEIVPAREGTALRGAIEAFAQAVTIALQYGVPLDAFVDSFAHARFGGSAGPVEGDPQIAQASSVPDYVFRTLASHYLGRAIDDPSESGADTAGETPLLPMALPIEPPTHPPSGRRRGRPSLRLVS